MAALGVRTSSAAMPPVDEGLPVLEHEGDAVAGQCFEAPERPISAPPVLDPDGSNLFAFQAIATHTENREVLQAWAEPPDRPSSAPPFQEKDLDELGTSEPTAASKLGAIGSSRVPPSRQPILGPKGEGLFAFPTDEPKISHHSLVLSPPPALRELRESSVDSGPHPTLSISGDSRCGSAVDLQRMQDAQWGKGVSREELGVDRRCTPPPSGLPSHLALCPSPGGLSTPPPPGFGSPGPLTPGLGSQGLGGGDYGPALLHPGAVRAFDPIDRPISAPPALDPGATLLGMQACHTPSLPGATDIRCDDSYNEFFQLYQEQNMNLPPPLDPSPDLMRSRGRPDAQYEPAQEPPGEPGTQPDGFAGAAFAAATGFPDPSLMSVYHAGHLPRSPSPPWESSGTSMAMSPAGVAGAVSGYSQQLAGLPPHLHLRQQQQQPPMVPGMPLPSQNALGLPTGLGPAGGHAANNPDLFAAAQAAVYAQSAAGRHPSLPGAGFPTNPYAEGQSSAAFPAQFGMSSLPPPRSPLGSRIPGQGQMAPLGAVEETAISSHGSPADMAKKPRELPSEVPDHGRGLRVCATPTSAPGGNSTSSIVGGITGAGGPAASNATAPASTAARRGGDRAGFKMSHLEDIFATNAFLHNVNAIARDQAGCRMLQHKLDEGHPEVTNAIFMEVLTHCVDLMMDPFGNYLCQKLMELCNHRQLELILDKVCADLVRISLNMHGARAVQKLIDAVRASPLVQRMAHALEGSVVILTQDPNGNHVVQRCLEVFPPEAKAFIFRSVADRIGEVATHRHGCRIVQRCIDAAHGSPHKQVLELSICRSGLTLVQDPFGNYVVQYVLGLQDAVSTALIISSMYGRLHVLSRQKFSSNVVERCLQLSGPEDRDRMIRELSDPRGLGDLLKDVYGNYVVQSALTLANEQQLQLMLSFIRPVLPSLRSSGQGRRIAQKLEKKYPQLRGGSENSTSANPSGSRMGGPPAINNSTSDHPIAAMSGPPLRSDSALAAGPVPNMGGVGMLSMQGVPALGGISGTPLMPGMQDLLGSRSLQPGFILGNGTVAGAPVGTASQENTTGNLPNQLSGLQGGSRQKKGRRGKN